MPFPCATLPVLLSPKRKGSASGPLFLPTIILILYKGEVTYLVSSASKLHPFLFSSFSVGWSRKTGLKLDPRPKGEVTDYIPLRREEQREHYEDELR